MERELLALPRRSNGRGGRCLAGFALYKTILHRQYHVKSLCTRGVKINGNSNGDMITKEVKGSTRGDGEGRADDTSTSARKSSRMEQLRRGKTTRGGCLRRKTQSLCEGAKRTRVCWLLQNEDSHHRNHHSSLRTSILSCPPVNVL